jgi:hypothetical protein
MIGADESVAFWADVPLAADIDVIAGLVPKQAVAPPPCVILRRRADFAKPI